MRCPEYRKSVTVTYVPAIMGILLATAALSVGAAPGRDGWDPLARPAREADTLFLPDLSSPDTIEAAGGFLHGHHDEGREKLRPLFAFTEGPFGPAVRVAARDGKHYWVFFPLDGLIGADAFTIEFRAKSDRLWAAEDGATILRLNSRENEISFDIRDGGPVVAVKSPQQKNRRRVAARAGALKQGRWHAFAATLKERTLRFYVDGRDCGRLDGVRFATPWSDGAAGTEGVLLGGAPWRSSGAWIAAVRISHTARMPGTTVARRSLRTAVTVDAARPSGSVPPPYIGSLHPGHKQWPPSKHPGATPRQIRGALQVVRTDKFLQATPMKRGGPDAAYPARGRTGRFSYDWQVVDRTLDWFAAHGVRPYISIDATPRLLGGSVAPFAGEKLRTALSRSAAFGPEKPADPAAWAAVVEDFVHHVLREHRTAVPWWGVWNEPDQPGFWNGTVEEYLDLYETTVRAVRTVDPAARVGGPESGLDGPYIGALIRRCAARDLPLDFVSYHDYSGDLNTPERARAVVDRLTTAAGLETPMPLVLGEFNWSAGNLHKPGWPRFHRDFWHIRAFGAAYTAAALVRMAEIPAVDLVVWSHTHYGDPRSGGWSATQLIGPHGEQWAPYNALKGWKTVVGGRRLPVAGTRAPGVSVLATGGQGDAVGIVLVNYGFAQRREREVQLSITGLRPGRWHLRGWRVDPAHSSRWDAAEDRPEGAARDDLEPAGAEDRRVGAGQELVVRRILPPWSSRFIRIERR